jgi:hypothetical protein
VQKRHCLLSLLRQTLKAAFWGGGSNVTEIIAG